MFPLLLGWLGEVVVDAGKDLFLQTICRLFRAFVPRPSPDTTDPPDRLAATSTSGSEPGNSERPEAPGTLRPDTLPEQVLTPAQKRINRLNAVIRELRKERP
jgi:hypothetical protein